MKKYVYNKNHGLKVSRAVTRVQIARAGFKAAPAQTSSDPLHKAFQEAFSEKSEVGLSERMIRNLADA